MLCVIVDYGKYSVGNCFELNNTEIIQSNYKEYYSEMHLERVQEFKT